jgi:hypothetical protein
MYSKDIKKMVEMMGIEPMSKLTKRFNTTCVAF